MSVPVGARIVTPGDWSDLDLDPKRRYEAQIYRDAPQADYRTHPIAYEIKRQPVSAKDQLTLKLAPGGGTAIRFKAVE